MCTYVRVGVENSGDHVNSESGGTTEPGRGIVNSEALVIVLIIRTRSVKMVKMKVGVAVLLILLSAYSSLAAGMYIYI